MHFTIYRLAETIWYIIHGNRILLLLLQRTYVKRYLHYNVMNARRYNNYSAGRYEFLGCQNDRVICCRADPKALVPECLIYTQTHIHTRVYANTHILYAHTCIFYGEKKRCDNDGLPNRWHR